MKRLVLAILLAANVAYADSTPLVVAPKTWQRVSDPELAKHVASLPHFGGVTAVVDVDQYVATGTPNNLLVVRVSAVLSEGREVAARSKVDELHQKTKRASHFSSQITELGWAERANPDTKQVEAALDWEDKRNALAGSDRVLVAANATQLVSITGECIAKSDTDAGRAALAECKASLATLDTGIALADRIAFGLAPVGSEPPSVTPPVAPSAGGPSMQDGTHVPLPPLQVPQSAPKTDRRPVYVGAGVVVLAAVFWWNRKRRERFEREDQETEKPQ